MKDYMFETLAESDNIRVFISFSQDTESKSKTIYIKSHTRVSEGNITKGVVIAAIKEANIPVKNGVIHLIHKPLMIVDHSVKQFLEVYQAPTLNKKKNLYFNVVEIGNNRTLTVEGGGVNATVVQPDIAAKNGIIHIIDRVLGVPYSTVFDKLRTDPMLKETMSVKQKEGAGRAEKRTEELVNNVREIISNAPRTSVRTLSQQVGVSIGTCHTILKKDLPVIKKSRKSTIPEE
ncbi:periostin-related [Holotrichia oblita]|uniref:Periostin-related n=1 Tax=Holotrichia oblita TaxID=644536 RepID=A0ACB9SYH0_HOLOL|nr:periostin-related [Holotrichia oblita]